MQSRGDEDNRKNEIRLDVLMNLYFIQFMTFAEFLNEDPKKVPTIKYAKYILYEFGEQIKKMEDAIKKERSMERK